jgi:hypothetical protein
MPGYSSARKCAAKKGLQRSLKRPETGNVGAVLIVIFSDLELHEI